LIRGNELASSDCVFCRIVAGELPADRVFDTESVLAFRDINPVAPTHILIIPKQHIPGPGFLDATTAAVVGEIFLAARVIAEKQGFDESGYRLVMNQGRHGGQSVFHAHLHLLAGRQMGWPPG
jgi:histidine triad (HIT) family protein